MKKASFTISATYFNWISSLLKSYSDYTCDLKRTGSYIYPTTYMPPSLYLSKRLGNRGSHLFFPRPSLLPFFHHLPSIHQQLCFPLIKRKVFVDGGHLVLTVTAGVFFGLHVLLYGGALFRAAETHRRRNAVDVDSSSARSKKSAVASKSPL